MMTQRILMSLMCAAMIPLPIWSFTIQSMPNRGPGARIGIVQNRVARSMGAKMLAPSGIDGLPLMQQQLIFAGIYAGLGFGTVAGNLFFITLEKALPNNWFNNWSKTWPLLGVVFILVGVAHFTAQGAFMSIYPPPGTWGMWALPGSAEFHVAWTGVAELLGGLGLVGGSAVAAFGPDDVKPKARQLAAVSAASLAGLTLAVSPANIYMYTHGAMMVGAGPDGPVPMSFHYGRFVAQIVILSCLIATARRASE